MTEITRETSEAVYRAIDNLTPEQHKSILKRLAGSFALVTETNLGSEDEQTLLDSKNVSDAYYQIHLKFEKAVLKETGPKELVNRYPDAL